MAVKQSVAGIWASSSTSAAIVGCPVEYLCDLESEIPVGVEGDGAYCKDSHKYFKRKASEWIELGSSGESASLPAGIILAWHGLIANIPSGWILCNGSNGTPDLRGKFLKAAPDATEAGDTGGSATHTHSDHAALVHAGTAVADHASHTHTYSDIVNHTHPVVDPGHTHTQDAHSHIITSQTATNGGATSYEHGTLDTSSAEAEATETTATTVAVNQSATTGITTSNPVGGGASGTTAGPSATLTHGVTQPNNHAAQSHTTVNSEPPYYTVLFIMKT